MQATAEVSVAQTTLSQYRITAPISGVVATRHARLYEPIARDKPIIDLIDTTAMELELNVPIEEADRLQLGDELAFEVPSLANRSFVAKIAAVVPQIDASTRTLRVRAEVTNDEGILLDGMFAIARVQNGAAREGTAIPALALRGSEGQQYVWAVRDDRAQRVTVSAAARDGDWVEVTGDLAASETVVVAGAAELKSGMPVVAVDGLSARANEGGR